MSRNLSLGTMEVHVSEPAAAGPHPAMIVTHHRPGVDSFTRTVTARLAQNGYVAAAPNFFHRRPKGEDTVESAKHMLDVDIVADIGATLGALQKMPNVRADRIGIVGHCMGGRMSFLGAASFPAIRACGIFYGGSIGLARGEGRPAPLALAKDVTCPVFGFFGNDDQNPSPQNVKELADALDSAGKTRSFHSYDGAGHAFQNFSNVANYREDQSEDAWVKLLTYLDRTLKRG